MLSDLLAARAQMAMSLGFHIVFACIGMTMPFLMVAAQVLHRRTQNPIYEEIRKAWLKGVAILFATGAVSGTVLSFELGLLWPRFMEFAGPIIGMPFSLEGAAFFLEAIALGFYIYGRDRLSYKWHLFTGIVVGISGVLSGLFVVCANAWMNSPAGFEVLGDGAINIEPFKAMFNDAWVSQTSHMIIAAFEATGFAVAGVHAFQLYRKRYNNSTQAEFHRRAMHIALVMAAIAALIQPLNGHAAAQDVAKRQPAKLAAMEAQFETKKYAPITIGGIADTKNRTVSYGIEIPGVLSFLAFNDFSAEVKGLEEFPEDEWPPVNIVHFAFQIMVGIGTMLAAFATGYFLLCWRRKDWLLSERFYLVVALLTPLGFLALEAGWVVTEVGRQPWIIYGVMRTADAVTAFQGISYHFILFTLLYIGLTFLVIFLMKRQLRAIRERL